MTDIRLDDPELARKVAAALRQDQRLWDRMHTKRPPDGCQSQLWKEHEKPSPWWIPRRRK